MTLFMIPEEEPIVATLVLLLDHVPPPIVSVKVSLFPWHMALLPLMIPMVMTVSIAVI